ncbi:MAG: hypothetical protein ACK4IX_15380, partial [Candidatus Sericytochromatia bacterium]
FLQKALRSNDTFYLKKNKKKMSSDMLMANTWNEELFNNYSKEEIKTFLLPINPVNKLNENEELISYIKNLVLDPVYQLK